MQVVGFEVEAVDRLAGVDVAGGLDGGDGGVVVEDFEGDRVVVLLRGWTSAGSWSVEARKHETDWTRLTPWLFLA